MKRLRFAIIGALLILAPTAFAQTGTVTGSIHDQKTGEDLVGANVLLVGTTLGASADLDGHFTIRNVPPGTYELRISYVGYTAKTVQGVTVKAGETATFDIALGVPVEEKAKEEVVITAERVLSTEAAVLAERQKAATIGDAVSAEQIRRSPDATSGDALKRVTGVSIVDNKFVFVRGVTDRYNVTALNGVSVTSTDTDVDRKSFSFDLLPANLLENTIVVKTATPDLPGDFSGGLVQVNTLDFPASRVGRVQITPTYSGDTTNKAMMEPVGGGHDWLGKDDGSRALPPGDLRGNSLAQQLPNDWALHESTAPVGASFNLSYGDRYPIHGDELGFVGAFSYRNAYLTSAFNQEPSYQGVPFFQFDGTRYQRSVLWGGLLNLNYKLGGLHKFSFKNNYNQSGEEKVNVSEGLPASGEFVRKQTNEWDERSFYLTQLAGEHKIPSFHALEVNWRGYYSTSVAEEPNREGVEYERGGSGYSLKNSYRSWSKLNEDSRGASTDITYPLAATKIKIGGLLEKRQRDYGIQAYWNDPSNLPQSGNYYLLALPIDKIFDPNNYGAGKFNFTPITTFTGEYDGTHDLGAAYAMVDRGQTIAGQRLRIVGGVRVEDSDIRVHSIDQLGDMQPVTTELARTDALPSANLTWSMREDTNLRLAYGRSLNRPEFREMADVLYYDFDNEQNVVGNPTLDRALIDNYDVRLEWFPNVGEVMAASFFYKDFENAIEENLQPSPERFVRSWFNSSTGKNYGIELECRKSLGFLARPLRFFSLTGNYTRIESAIQYTEQHTDPSGSGATITVQQERVMQGQSPWSVNLSMLFAAPELGTSVNFLYGTVGRRLDAVGDSRDQDVYEEPRDLLELAITQTFRRRWEAKLSARNLLGEDELLTSGPERSTFSRLTRDPIWGLSLAFGL